MAGQAMDDTTVSQTQAQGGDEERHEVKFAAYALQRPVLENWIHMHPAGFIRPYPDREINNIYFDTIDYRAYAENLAGVSERSKVRYRWYGDNAEPAAGSLEVKLKRNHFGWKRRYRLAQSPYREGFGWHEIRSELRTHLPFEGRLWLDQNSLPVMINRYTRRYFCTTNSAIRVTIDSNQRVYDQRTGDKPNFSKPAIMQDTLVVEVKFARASRADAVRILGTIPLRVGRYSKYMNAVRAVGFV
jgi:hypothetical protein